MYKEGKLQGGREAAAQTLGLTQILTDLKTKNDLIFQLMDEHHTAGTHNEGVGEPRVSMPFNTPRARARVQRKCVF